MKSNTLSKKELKNRVGKPACSIWFDLKKVKPKMYDWVLVNTQYCTYPATIAKWNGIEFKSSDGGNFGNITHWANVNDLGMSIKPIYNENEEKDRLNLVFELLEKVLELSDTFKYRNKYWKSFYHSLKYGIAFIVKQIGKL